MALSFVKTTLFFVYLFAITSCFAAAPKLGSFLLPPANANPVYNYLDTLNVTWQSATNVGFTSPRLLLWFTESVAPFKQTLVYNAPVHTSSWSLIHLSSLPASKVCTFEILQDPPAGSTEKPRSYLSNPFVLTRDASQKAKTWSLATLKDIAATTTNPNPNPTTPQPASNPPAQSPTTTSAASSPSSPTTHSTTSTPPPAPKPLLAGMSLPIVIAIAGGSFLTFCIIGLLTYFLLRRRKHQRTKDIKHAKWEARYGVGAGLDGGMAHADR